MKAQTPEHLNTRIPEYRNPVLNCLRRFHVWQHRRRQVAALGSADQAEFERAIHWFMTQGESSQRVLHRALRAAPDIACGAAVTLYRQGSTSGLRSVLTRCYDEEWGTQYHSAGSREISDILRRLDWRGILMCVGTALEEASQTGEEWACLQLLIVALSGLRTLRVFASAASDPAAIDAPTINLPTVEPAEAFDAAAALTLYQQALYFGPQCLRTLKPMRASRPFLNNMTHWIRAEAVRRLLTDCPSEAFPLLLTALEAEDWHIGQTAISGLLRLHDRRAVPALEAIAFTVGHPLAPQARRAVEHLAGTRAESLTLLRASRPETADGELLRPLRTHDARLLEAEREMLLHVE